MACVRLSVVVVVTMALWLMLCGGSSAKVTIRVVNYTGHDMGIHCKSRDDDMGHQTRRDKQDVSFSFNPNIWGTTHFWCDVYWMGKHKYFPAYGGSAPKRSMTYEVYGYGFYRDGSKFADW